MNSRRMTALRQYARLECPGLWRETAEAPRREVIVFFREASLIIADPRSEQPLAHWSLPAVQRLNDQVPAIYAPGDDQDGEVVEIEEADMIAALSTVRGAIEAARPHPGRLRNWMLGGVLGLVVLGAFFVPGAIISHTIDVAPAATRARLGEMALADMVRVTGAPCAAPLGRAATETLATRVFGAASWKIIVVREGLDHPVHLPNRQILIPASLVENHDSPDAVAGAALAEGMRSQLDDPLRPLLQHAGLWATLRLLTTGRLPDGAMNGYGKALAEDRPPEVPAEELLTRFTKAQVPLTPWLRTLPQTERTAALMADDPYPEGAPRPIMDDNEWVSLSGICR
ncbi:hypothetical protein [Falsirhodobacter deserti]|uniref:hypothetical protein n=1 Tax=Falsirhodobacter deserti TaxID=1365611 RepID=UPI001F4D44E5|nr:hypothetical protein [Falsirhodobacter deserti]